MTGRVTQRMPFGGWRCGTSRRGGSGLAGASGSPGASGGQNRPGAWGGCTESTRQPQSLVPARSSRILALFPGTMSLSPGTSLGHYDVTTLLGEGGMGQVWQATDTQLNRQVALKILPDAFADDPDRLARFTREAQILASLNHPNIAAIHGIEESEGTRALVLELVEGPTLADRISQGPIPLDEALPIAKQIAEALEAAHEAGVIHRDLKPANIKVREDGTVKVLDFGLAKALDPAPASDLSESPTLTAAATQMGVILGTAAYMSPEQARGKTVDKRADIWAFGCVLFEMLTGRRVFESEDVSLTLADVMRAEPAWERLPDGVPLALVTFLRRCLQKDARQRIRDIGDVRLALEGAFETLVSTQPDGIVPPALRLWQHPVPLAISVLALVVASLLVGRMLSSAPPAAPPSDPVRLSVMLPEGTEYVNFSSPSRGLAVSEDGRQVVFRGQRDGRRQLFRRSLDDRSVTPIPGTDAGSRSAGALQPFFSPDGTSVAFFDDGDLKRVGLDGTPPITIAEGIGVFAFGDWDNSEIVYADLVQGLFRVSAEGGTPVRLLSGRYFNPTFVPNTGDILFTAEGPGGLRVEMLCAGSTQPEPVLDDARLVALTASNRLVFERDGVMMAATFDAIERSVGPPVPVLDRYAHDQGGRTPQVTVSASGTLVHVPERQSTAPRSLEWVDFDGTMTRVGEVPGGAASVDLSPVRIPLKLNTDSGDRERRFRRR